MWPFILYKYDENKRTYFEFQKERNINRIILFILPQLGSGYQGILSVVHPVAFCWNYNHYDCTDWNAGLPNLNDTEV